MLEIEQVQKLSRCVFFAEKFQKQHYPISSTKKEFSNLYLTNPDSFAIVVKRYPWGLQNLDSKGLNQFFM